MMYLSHVDNSNYIIAILLDDNFLSYIRNIKDLISNLKLDIDYIQFNHDISNARLIESGSYPYEDKQIHEITNGEDPLDYYRFHISKYYFPTEDYWYELKPSEVYLTMFCGDFFGFSFVVDGKEYDGRAISISDWELYLSQ